MKTPRIDEHLPGIIAWPINVILFPFSFFSAGLIVALLAASAALAGDATQWRVHYTLRGVGRDITILAQSSQEARRVVQDLFPGAIVTGAHRAR
jgi:predicted small secreted protein